MGNYLPSSEKERAEMLKAVGAGSYRELYIDVPESMFVEKLALPDGKSELETAREMAALADKNVRFKHIFRGALAYDHYIPAIVKSVCSKEEFVTAYTPYQAEISQGVLQSIFEYQTGICELTGMDVSNACVYDGASAAAEAVAMCVDKKRRRALISAALNPMVIETIKTYCFGSSAEFALIPEKDGATDLAELKKLMGDDAACVVAASPNYFGVIEDMDAIGAAAHENGAKLVAFVNPISLALLKAPREYGADIAVGEGQPLGMPLSFGGPYLGFMAATHELMRRLPGRIVGETADSEGRRAFVLTLQAREQHIRREKASSNICSNEALCAMTASVYMAAMGERGMKQAASLSASKARLLCAGLEKLGFKRKYKAEFFNEFVTECPCGANELCEKLEKYDILAGLPVGEKELLWCCTEKNTKSDIEYLLSAVKEALA